MRIELQQQLYAIDPIFFMQKDWDMTKTCMCWGIECGDGWFEPIKKFVMGVSQLNKIAASVGMAIVASQIKSKWADFTCYWNIMPLDESNSAELDEQQQAIVDGVYWLMDAAVDACENECSKTCEICGKSSPFEDEVIACGSWLTVKCLDCAQKQQREEGIITNARDGFMFLSPFAKCGIVVDGVKYPTFIGAYYGKLYPQYKTLFASIFEPRDAQNVAVELGLCKADDGCLPIMEELLKARYNENNRERSGLLSTKGLQIKLFNRGHENFWGECTCPVCRKQSNSTNNYGKLLMKVRDELLNG